MKFAKLALALAAITLLSSPTIADVIEDPLLVSFERDMNYEASNQVVQPSFQAEIDPLVEALRAALSNPVKPEPLQGAAIGRNGG
jgi:phage gp29-like protein